MLYFVLFIHMVVCISMIVIVLLQADKGEGLSGAFGGGDRYTHFGDTGPTTFIQKITQLVAVIFVITSLTLANMSKLPANAPVPAPKSEAVQTTNVETTAVETKNVVEQKIPVKPVEETKTETTK